MNRDAMLERLDAPGPPWDVLVIGGGATGLGCAVDAAARGYRTALVERGDFAGGTSSCSTKLIHGGVRYLRRGNLRLVLESLGERSRLCANAPHLVTPLRFVVPAYHWWEAPYYGAGLVLYDALAGGRSLGRTRYLSPQRAATAVPTLARDGLRAALSYHDAQFDDARLALALAATAVARGAAVVNYVEAEHLLRRSDNVCGAGVRDLESGRRFDIMARVVINAAGAWADGVRRLDDPHSAALLRPSRGSHVVVGPEFLPGDSALMIPHTDDARVLFAIPWHGCVVIGTTEVEVDAPPADPSPSAAEIDFILAHAGRYLSNAPTRRDVRSVFAGLRPLVDSDPSVRTASMPRDHDVIVSPSGLVTVVGGKWTTYRRMARDAVDRAAVVGRLAPFACPTASLPIAAVASDRGGAPAEDAVRRAAREEMARTVEDVLARRSRLLITDARAALTAAADVARVMADELGRSGDWEREQIASFALTVEKHLPA